MAYLIKTNGEVEEVKPANGKHFTLEEMQGFVGGYIEVINPKRLIAGDYTLMSDTNVALSITKKTCMVINEEGKCQGLDINPFAAQMYEGKEWGDIIVGPALLCEFGKEIS